MKTAMLLLVLSTLAACAQTTGGAGGVNYVSGDGDYYQGIVSPK
ncbi:hypothetical protein [Ensifer adhaerens]|nr:hypothetical protein [Ensifer adhaerens]